ncbi:hypothetical protein ES708_18402 [subsurface metagenome]
MNELYKSLNEKDQVIEKLKTSRKTRGKIIVDMIAKALDKDKEIANLKVQLELAIFVIEWLARK